MQQLRVFYVVVLWRRADRYHPHYEYLPAPPFAHTSTTDPTRPNLTKPLPLPQPQPVGEVDSFVGCGAFCWSLVAVSALLVKLLQFNFLICSQLRTSERNPRKMIMFQRFRRYPLNHQGDRLRNISPQGKNQLQPSERERPPIKNSSDTEDV